MADAGPDAKIDPETVSGSLLLWCFSWWTELADLLHLLGDLDRRDLLVPSHTAEIGFHE